MIKKWCVIGTVLFAAFFAQAAHADNAVVPEGFSHGYFDCAAVYPPKGNVRGTALILVDSRTTVPGMNSCVGDKLIAWNMQQDKLARSLANDGILVAGLDVASVLKEQEKGGTCFGIDGDLENISRVLQARYQLPGYLPPVLVGSGQTGGLVYAHLASADKGTYRGGISANFTQDMTLNLPLCKGRALMTQPPVFDTQKNTSAQKNTKKKTHYTLQASPALDVPWEVLPAQSVSANSNMTPFLTAMQNQKDMHVTNGVMSGSDDEIRAIHHAVNRMIPIQVMQQAAPTVVGDLPLIEVPVTGKVKQQNVLTIFISGDGGWAGIDKEVAGLLVAKGYPVVGLDSLRYFWKKRTPDSVTQDIERIMQYYQKQSAWKYDKVMLVGYSQGANVLPFVLNRMHTSMKQQLASVVLLGLTETADFEFHVTNWMSASKESLPILPEITRLPDNLATCIYGADDDESICPLLTDKKSPLRLIKLPGDHHFDGNYNLLLQKILSGL